MQNRHLSRGSANLWYSPRHTQRRYNCPSSRFSRFLTQNHRSSLRSRRVISLINTSPSTSGTSLHSSQNRSTLSVRCVVTRTARWAGDTMADISNQVPAITYGGPHVAPDEPSPLSFKLAESNVILEFLADAYPEANLMPIDPVQRARVRFFMDAVTNRYMPAHMAWVLDREPDAAEKHLKAIQFLQELIPESGKYAVGDSYTIADACITPFIYRLNVIIENDIGKYPVGNGPKFGESLKDPKYAKFMAYASAITARPVAKEIWEPVSGIVERSCPCPCSLGKRKRNT